MTKSEEVKEQLQHLKSRVTHLTESRRRLKIFDGMNDGKTLCDTGKRLKVAEDLLVKFIDNNIEYIL